MATHEHTQSGTRPAPGINYGGVIIALAILLNFASMAFFYSYGVFLKPLAEHLGSSRTQASLPSMIFLFSMSFSAPIVGILLDKYPIKITMVLSTLIMGAGLLLMGQVNSHLQLYIIVSLFIGFSIQGMGALATTKLLTNWFHRYRGLALGASAIGLSISAMLMPVLSTTLISHYDWKISYMIFGVSLIAITPLIWFFIYTTPAQKGLLADFNQPVSEATASQNHQQEKVYSSTDILKSTLFWKIIFVIGVPSGVLVTMITHTVSFLSDIGFSAIDAAKIFSTVGIAALAGKVGWGWLIDRFDSRIAILLALVIQASGIALFIIGESYWQFTAAAIVYGFGMASIPSFQGVLVAKGFGNASFGKVFGYTLPAMLPFTLGFIYLGAFMHDKFSSYNPAFYTFIALFAVAALIATSLKFKTE
jgi:MFS family permease